MNKSMKRVMVFGTFDGLHKGHMNFLEQARGYGSTLIIVIGRDSNVKGFKGRLPAKDEEERMELVLESGLGDMVVLGDKDDIMKPIEDYKPDFICLGYDQDNMNLKEEIKNRGLDAITIRLFPYKEHKYKSSILNNKNQEKKK